MEKTPESGENELSKFEQCASIAQNPIDFIKNLHDGGSEVPQVLYQIRLVRTVLNSILGADESIQLEGVDKDFASFYTYGNDTLQHYEGLFSLLKRSGLERYEVQSVTMGTLPRGTNEKIKLYIALTEEALNNVYASD